MVHSSPTAQQVVAVLAAALVLASALQGRRS